MAIARIFGRRWSGLVSVAICLGFASFDSFSNPPEGFLLGNVGSADGSPKEGDIKLRDSSGRWLLVSGAPENPRPFTKESVTVAIIDSGILTDHPQMKGLVDKQKDFTGEGMADKIGHGTLVSIIVLLPRASLSKTDAEIIPFPRFIEAKVANRDGTIDKNNVILAIQWAVQQGAQIVNMSLGFKKGTDDYSGICDIMAKSPNVLFVAAAGNFGPTVAVYPAICTPRDNLISVGVPNVTYSGSGDVYAPGTVVLKPQAAN